MRLRLSLIALLGVVMLAATTNPTKVVLQDTATGAVTLAGSITVPSNASGTVPQIEQQSTGALDNASWYRFVANGGASNHDHVLADCYNCTWNDSTDAWSRPTSGSHALRLGLESRFTTGNPSVLRGSVEWNFDVDTAVTGTPNFNRRPWFWAYDMDNHLTQVNIGDAQDTSSAFVSFGQASSFSGVWYDGRGGKPFVFASNAGSHVTSAADAVDNTKSSRLIISPDAGPSASDRASYICTQGSVGQSLVLEPGKDQSDALGQIYLGNARPTVVNIPGSLVITPADLAVGSCTLGRVSLDSGGATKEWCACGTANVWGCWNLATGAFNANGPAD